MVNVLIVAAVVAAAPVEHPLAKDKTGVHWMLPFAEANKKAESEKRLLLIKPVAFGTTADGGW